MQQYRHYKGGLYEYLCTARLESDPAIDMIVYRASDGTVWTRTAQNFFECVEKDGKQVPRFEKLE